MALNVPFDSYFNQTSLESLGDDPYDQVEALITLESLVNLGHQLLGDGSDHQGTWQEYTALAANAKGIQISNEDITLEGLSDIINKIKTEMGKSTKGKEILSSHEKTYSSEFKKASAELRRAIKVHYLNDRWLSKQTLVEEQISAKGIVEGLVMDGKVWQKPTELWAEHVKRFEALGKQFSHAMETYNKEIQEIHKEVLKLYKESDDVGKALNHGIGKIKSLKDPGNGINPKEWTLLGDVVFTVGKRQFTVSERTSAPTKTPITALNREEIKEYAHLMEQVLDHIENKKDLFDLPTFLDFKDGDDFWDVAYEEEISLDEAYNDLTYHQHVWDQFETPQFDCQEKALAFLKGLEAWIDRSIK